MDQDDEELVELEDAPRRRRVGTTTQDDTEDAQNDADARQMQLERDAREAERLETSAVLAQVDRRGMKMWLVTRDAMYIGILILAATLVLLFFTLAGLYHFTPLVFFSDFASVWVWEGLPARTHTPRSFLSCLNSLAPWPFNGPTVWAGP